MLSLYPSYLKRYRDIALLLIRHQQRELVTFLGLDKLLENGKDDKETPKQAEANEVVADLEKLGPTFVKIGQLLSTRTDMLPEEYLTALSRLQDQVKPLPFETIKATIEQELGDSVDVLFEFFDEEPLASASLGQVHRAKLWRGSEVVVKVQRPNARNEIVTDLEVLGQLADFLDHNTLIGHRYRFGRLLMSLKRSLMQEIDYRIEAENAVRFKANLRHFPRILIPDPYPEFSNEKVLTLQFIDGVKLTSLNRADLKSIDSSGLARELFQCYMHQVLVDGFFHADPHPGNLFLTPDQRIALIDFGMVVNLPDAIQHKLIKLILGLTEGHGEEVADAAIEMSRQEKQFDRDSFRERVSHMIADLSHAPVGRVPTGHIVLKMQAIGGECGLLMPLEITMLGKVLMHMDRVGAILCPTMVPREEMRLYSMQVIQYRSMNMMTADRLYKSILEAGEFSQALPYRLNKFTQMLVDNELKVQVEAVDEKKLMSRMDKIANRVTTGLILASLIIGASIVLHMARPPYTFIAGAFFILASLGGVYLAVQSLREDK